MDYKTIVVSVSDSGVATVKFNQPEKRNALSLELREELLNFFETAKNNDEIRAILLTGEGKAFSAGGDLSTLKEVEPVAGRKRLQIGHDLIRSMVNLEKPIVAAVNGAAAGAGVSIALASDIVIAGQSSIFIQSFVNVGLIPDLGSIYFLPRLIGRHRAMELMFLGDRVSAQEAKEMGLINRVVEDDKLLEEAGKIAEKLASGPSMALGFMKKLVNRSILNDLDETLEVESFAQGFCFGSEDFKEGVQAFFEKRKPRFK